MGFNASERLASIQIGVSAASVLAGTGLSTNTALIHSAGSGLSVFIVDAAGVSMVGQMIDIGPGFGSISNLNLSTKGFSALIAVTSALKFSNVYDIGVSQLSTVNGELFVGSGANGFSALSSAGIGIMSGQTRIDQIGEQQTAGVTTLKGAMAVMDVVETAVCCSPIWSILALPLIMPILERRLKPPAPLATLSSPLTLAIAVIVIL